MIRLTAWRTDGNPNVLKNVHVGEWWFDGLNPACAQGSDLSDLESGFFADDVDGNTRTGRWDIGADQQNELTVGFQGGPVQWWEEEGAAKVQVMLSEPAPVRSSVRFTTHGASAVEGSDFDRTAGTLVFEPGEVSKIISVPLINDGFWDAGEDFWIELHDAAGARLVNQWWRFEIHEGDAPVRVRLKNTMMEVSEADGVVDVEFELSKPSPSTTIGSWDVIDATAFFSTDYRGPGDGAPWRNYSIPSGSTDGVVQYEIIHDDELEPPEGFFVVGGYLPEAQYGVPFRAYVQILDSGPPPPGVSFESPYIEVDEGTGVAQLRVLLSRAPESDVSVRYRFVQLDQAWPEAATAGLDYEDTPGELVFTGGETEQIIEIQILEDDLVEDIAEVFVAELFDPVGVALRDPATIDVWIVDNEPRPVIAFLEPEFIEVDEGDQTIEFTVQLTEPAATGMSVRVQTIADEAEPGLDFEAVDDLIEFTDGQWEHSFEIRLMEDLLYEGNESFGVRLYDPVGVILEFQYTSEILLVDNEEPPALVTFASESIDYSEGSGAAQLSIRLEKPMTRDATVRYRTVAGTAAPGLDFDAVDDEVFFQAGQVEKTIEVTFVNDGMPEDEETFRVELYDPVDLELGYPPFTDVVIEDDEPRPTTVRFSVGVDAENRLPGPIGIDIANGVATFSESPALFALVPGDRLEIDGAGVVFLGECTTETQCAVSTGQGDPPADLSGGVVGSAMRAFPSLEAALTGAADAEHLGTWDLSAANAALEILCYSGWGEPDTTPVTIENWITSTDNAIRVITPPLAPKYQLPSRHLGRWEEAAYHLVVSNGTCISSSVGNLVLEGLQLQCSGDSSSDIYGVLLDGINADVRVSETIIRLDGSAALGDRIAVKLAPASSGGLVVRNSIFYDIGDGSAENHTGIVNDSATATLLAVNNTVSGGAYGIRSLGGSATVVNNLVLDATTACFDGIFDPASTRNLASDGTAPDPPAIVDGTISMTNPASGPGADFHLECGLRQKVSEFFNDFGAPYWEELEYVFDGDPETSLSSPNVNPARVVLGFDEPQTFTGLAVELSDCDTHRWMVEAADTAADFIEGGDIRTIVSERSIGAWGAETFLDAGDRRRDRSHGVAGLRWQQRSTHRVESHRTQPGVRSGSGLFERDYELVCGGRRQQREDRGLGHRGGSGPRCDRRFCPRADAVVRKRARGADPGRALRAGCGRGEGPLGGHGRFGCGRRRLPRVVGGAHIPARRGVADDLHPSGG